MGPAKRQFSEDLVEDQQISIRGTIQGRSKLVSGLEMRSVRGWLVHFAWDGDFEPLVGLDCSLLDFSVSSIRSSNVLVNALDSCQILIHSGNALPHHAVELCCGLGGLSTGAEAAGLRVVAGVDVSSWALEVFSLNHSAKGLLGSVADSQVRASLFSCLDRASVGYLMGFPCPPFSQMGDRRGFMDDRAWTLVHGLDLVYLLKGQFLILECTPQVESFPGVVEFLHEFALAMQFQWKSFILHLDEAWPTRRTRWWCVLLPTEAAPFLHLTDLPRASHLQRVSDLIPMWPVWNVYDEAQLVWDLQERNFLEQFAVLSDLVLQVSAKCPTLLHSLAHLDRACPCGCRAFGLSFQRLSRARWLLSVVLTLMNCGIFIRKERPCYALCHLRLSFRRFVGHFL